MAKKEKSGKVTVANIVSVLGLMLLAFFTYIGHSYLSGGETGMDILIAALVTGAAALLLWWLIKAKGAENELSKWKKIEIGSLIAYILLIIPASIFFGGIMHFFLVNDNKTAVKTSADQDLTLLTKLFSDYEANAKDAISRTRTGILPAVGTKQRWSADLTEFMNNNHINHSKESAESFINIQERAVLGANYKTQKEYFLAQKRIIKNVVESWSVMQIPTKAKLIEDLSTKITGQLNSLRDNGKFPNIGYNANSGVFTLEGYHEIPEVKLTQELKFHNQLKSASGFSVTALLVVLGIHLLVLFNYIMAYRTSTIGISKETEDDGGIILNL